jgi:beta-lactamase class A
MVCIAAFRTLLGARAILTCNVSASTQVHRLVAMLTVMLLLLAGAVAPARAAFMPPPMKLLRADLHRMAVRFPASSAVEVMDLSTGYHIGYNDAAVMPAASTIKVPVMVEVFKKLEAGAFTLNRRVTLLPTDKDYGSGELCDAPAYTTYTVEDLLDKMIDISDNTATNMLIRLVGLHSINVTMADLGLRQTHLRGYVRTDSWNVRQALESSPSDMVHLLALMAKRQLVDDWSSNEMISILEGDQINTLLPEPLPPGVAIAHKTGSFFDTLNDVGIVYGDTPYVIAVMTTHLPSLSIGRTFIRHLSLLAFQQEAHMAAWRDMVGVRSFDATNGVTPPDLRYWQHGGTGATQSGGR